MKLLLREGRLYLLILGVATILLFFIHPLLVLLPISVFFFLLFFFRDPERNHPVEVAGVVSFLSPADGRVTAVDEVEEGYLFKGKAQMVTIFLSPMDVHVNRSPMYGIIATVEHRKGSFRPAYIADAPSVNERNYVIIRNEQTQCLVVQIVGVLARRVVCWVKPGDIVKRGERFGLMKFGSCIQVFMPETTRTTVQAGNTVVGGETVIGVINLGSMG